MTKVVQFPNKKGDDDGPISAQEHARYIAEQLGEREWMTVVFAGRDSDDNILMSGNLADAEGSLELVGELSRMIVDMQRDRLPEATREAALSREMAKRYHSAMMFAFDEMKTRRPEDYELQGIMSAALEQLVAPLIAEGEEDAE